MTDITNNNRLNIFILCPNCHDVFDYGYKQDRIDIYHSVIKQYPWMQYTQPNFDSKKERTRETSKESLEEEIKPAVRCEHFTNLKELTTEANNFINNSHY